MTGFGGSDQVHFRFCQLYEMQLKSSGGSGFTAKTEMEFRVPYKSLRQTATSLSRYVAQLEIGFGYPEYYNSDRRGRGSCIKGAPACQVHFLS